MPAGDDSNLSWIREARQQKLLRIQENLTTDKLQSLTKNLLAKDKDKPYYGKQLPPAINYSYASMPKPLRKQWERFFVGYPGSLYEKFDIIEEKTRHLKGWRDKDRADLIRTNKHEYSRMKNKKYGPSKNRKK
jgi:hypothetical protein